MINIAYIIQSWYLGGVETGIYNIASFLKYKYPNQFNFHFIATDNQNIHPKFHSIGSAVYLGQKWGKIIQYLQQYNIHILQWGNVSQYAECGFKAQVPIIIERISGPRSLGKKHSFNTHIISSSDGIVSEIKKEWSGPITVIKNGVDIKSINPKKLFEKDDFVVVYPAARMGEGQNYQMLIEATIKARQKNPKIKLILMGDHPAHAGFKSIKSKLQQLAKPLKDSCVFTGFVLDPDPIIAGADLCVVPAKSHGISNALILAASMELPLISTNVGQNNEICHHNKNGYLVNLNDIDLLSRHILYLSSNSNLCSKMAEYGKQIVEQNFNIHKQSKKYYDLYSILFSYI